MPEREGMNPRDTSRRPEVGPGENYDVTRSQAREAGEGRLQAMLRKLPADRLSPGQMATLSGLVAPDSRLLNHR